MKCQQFVTLPVLVFLLAVLSYAGASTSAAEREGMYSFRLDAGPTGTPAIALPPLFAEEGLTVVEISAPAVLSRPKTKYMLTQDITTSDTAFTIGDDVRNVVLDLGGHRVVYNSQPRQETPGKPYAHCVYGVAIRGRGIENIVVRNGTIVQGQGGSSGCHAVSVHGGTAIELCRLMTQVRGPSTSNIAVVWTGPHGRIHDNYLDNRATAVAPGLFDPTGISISQTGKDWEVYNNTIIGGHQGIATGANALTDKVSNYRIHHNLINGKRIHGQKVPQAIICFGSAGCHIYENQIASDDSRGINLQAAGSGHHDVHHNLVACRYSTVAKEGNYVENRCYGYWERNGGANRVHDNIFIVGNETTGDNTSSTVGIVATMPQGASGRLKSAEYVRNRIIASHADPAADAVGVEIKRSDKDVVVSGNEIVARTAAVLVFDNSEGVQVSDNLWLRPPAAPTGKGLLAGDCAEKCRAAGNQAARLASSAQPPAVPLDLRVVSRIDAVELSWRLHREKDVAGYHVYAGGKRLNAYPVGGGFYVDLDLKGGSKRTYQVSAVDLAGRESQKSAPVEATLK